MTFAKNVERYSKWVLGSIVAVLAIAMIIPGTIGNADDDKSGQQVATIFGSVKVTEREMRDAAQKSGAWYRLKVVRDVDSGADYNSQQMAPYLFSFRDQPGLLARHDLYKPSEDD